MDKKDSLEQIDEREFEDRDRDGIDDEIEPPIPDIAAGTRKMRDRLRENTSTNPVLSGGDVDAQWDAAESSGDETVAGSMPTPGQGNVEEMGQAIGVTYADDEELKAGEKERSRDKHRWELDPASSEDYQERAREQKD